MPTEQKPKQEYRTSNGWLWFGKLRIGPIDLDEHTPDILHRLNTWDAMREALEGVHNADETALAELRKIDPSYEPDPSARAQIDQVAKALTAANRKPES